MARCLSIDLERNRPGTSGPFGARTTLRKLKWTSGILGKTAPITGAIPVGGLLDIEALISRGNALRLMPGLARTA